MKNKLFVFIVTFLIMIAITPFVFSKLMNSKFDNMLTNLKSKGIEIKEIKDKSTYILTDRVFLVKVPGEVFNESEIKYIIAEVESKFKNLPVTDVKFLGKIKEIDFKNKELNDINNLIKDKLNFLVVTPNFKVYRYKIFDNNISDNNFQLNFNGIRGVLNYPDNENLLNIKKIIFNIENKVTFTAENIKTYYKKDNYHVINNSELNFTANYLNNKFIFNDIKTHNELLISQKAKSNSKLFIKEINFNNQLLMKNSKLDFNLSNIDYKIIEKIQKENDKKNQQQLLKELISKGLNAKLKLDLNDIEVQKNKLGFIKLNAILKIKQDDNFFEKLNKKDFSDIDLLVKLQTTPKIATIISMTNPLFAALFLNAKQNENKLIVTFEIKNGEMLLNGKKIKSN